MNLKQLILVILSMVSLSLFAQDTYYYFKGQRIPLTVNPTIVNVITPISNIQYAPSRYPNILKSGLNIKAVVQNNKVNMSVIGCNTNSSDLSEFVDSIKSHGRSIVLPCYYNTRGEELVSSGYIYIKLKKATDYQLLQSISTDLGLTIDHQNIYMPLWYILRATSNDIDDLIRITNYLTETNYFEAAEPDLMRQNSYSSISWDENVSEQWGLYNAENDSIDINASSAWNYATGRGVKIGIFDSGIDSTHNDLKENISKRCYDIETSSSEWFVYNYHGTHVAGIIAAERNNGEFISGVAPDAHLISISTQLDVYSICETEKIANGFNWAVENEVDVLNCSWTWDKYQIITDAIDNVLEKGRGGKGCIMVVSSGNYNSDVVFPANYRTEILAVGAIKNTGIRYYETITNEDNDIIVRGSCYGNALDVAAPGVNILSTVLNNKIESASGTSMAAPHVSGIVALVLEMNPDLTLQEVCNIIEKSTIKVGNVEYTTDSVRPNGTWNQYYGYGLVDALKAVKNTSRKQIDY